MPSQHTPGPWQPDLVVNPTTRQAYPWAIWKDGVRVARVDSRPLAVRSEEEANARLIAAAPEMLALLKRITTTGYLGEIADEACALLAKVEGKE